MNVNLGISIKHHENFYWSLLWVALWWFVAAALFTILDHFHLISSLKTPSIAWWRSILEGIVLAPLIENAIMAGFILLLKPWAKDWMILVTIGLIAALAHINYGFRAITAAGLFILIARYYLLAQRRKESSPFILSCCLHAFFNTPAVVLALW